MEYFDNLLKWFWGFVIVYWIDDLLLTLIPKCQAKHSGIERAMRKTGVKTTKRNKIYEKSWGIIRCFGKLSDKVWQGKSSVSSLPIVVLARPFALSKKDFGNFPTLGTLLGENTALYILICLILLINDLLQGECVDLRFKRVKFRTTEGIRSPAFDGTLSEEALTKYDSKLEFE